MPSFILSSLYFPTLFLLYIMPYTSSLTTDSLYLTLTSNRDYNIIKIIKTLREAYSGDAATLKLLDNLESSINLYNLKKEYTIFITGMYFSIILLYLY